jgi:Na+-transporting NADH:ubiquinone oxidoreductase subunit NqrB
MDFLLIIAAAKVSGDIWMLVDGGAITDVAPRDNPDVAPDGA